MGSSKRLQRVPERDHTQFTTAKGVTYSEGASQTISYSPKIIVPIPVQTSVNSGVSQSSAVENTGTKSTGSSSLVSYDNQSSYAALNGLGSVNTESPSPYQQGSSHQPSPYPTLASVTGSADHGGTGTLPPAGNGEIQGNGHASVSLTESGSLGAESQPPAPAAEGYGKPSMAAAAPQTLTTKTTGIVTKVVTATIIPVAALPTSSLATRISEIQGNGRASVGTAESGFQGVENRPLASAAEGLGKPSIPAASSQTLKPTMTGIVTKVLTATIIPVAALPITSSAMNDLSRAAMPLITETLIPVPVSPNQYIKGPGSALYPSGNATSTYGTLASEGSSTRSASVQTGSNAVSEVQSASIPFTGGASKEASGIMAVVGVAIGAALIF